MPITAGQTTGSAVIAAAKGKADMQNSAFISTAEWLQYVQSSHQELYDLLLTTYGAEYYVATPYSFTTDGATGYYALPDDFYKLFGVDLLIQGSGEGGVWVTVAPFTFADRNRYVYPHMANWMGRTNLRYRLSGNNLWLTPLPASGQTIRLHYAPRLTAVDGSGSAVTDLIDGVSGWEEYVAIDAALKAKQKGEEDCQVLVLQKAAMEKRIEVTAENRDAGRPATVADTRWNSYSDPEGWGYNGGGF